MVEIERKLPAGSETFDESTGLYTIVSYRRNAAGRAVKITRTVKRVAEQRKVHTAVHRRRQLPKFGDCKGFAQGQMEENVSEKENKIINLHLTGIKVEEKSQADLLIESMKTPTIRKNVFQMSSEVRKNNGEMMEREERTARPDDDFPTVKISNLSIYATEGDVRHLLSKYSGVHRVKIATDRNTGVSRGYAFITFMHKSSADACIAELNGHGYDNLMLQVQASKSAAEFYKERLARQAAAAKAGPAPSNSRRRY